MLFNSFEFLVFLVIVFVLYWKVLGRSVRGQNAMLLVASYVFYGWWDWRFLSLLAFSSLSDFVIGLWLERRENPAQRKALIATSLFLNFGLLGVFKYFNFFADSFAVLLAQLGFQADMVTLEVILPVGISFYTFQTVGYSIDVYRRNTRAESDVLDFLVYVSFFPQLVAGPIERASNLLPQFKVPRSFDLHNASLGVRLMLWGFFKKIVIADNCAPIVTRLFENPEAATGLELCWGAVLFSFQIYGDFSGYSDIAIGVSRLFGFQLMTNFRVPYFARDVAEFWRRWHISLSTWFRDYLYIPLGGSKGSKAMTTRNTMIIFIVSGLWHGANWTFVVWGAIHALLFLPLVLRTRNRTHLDTVAQHAWMPNLRELWSMVFTYAAVCFAWIFFRAADMHSAMAYISAISSLSFLPTSGVNFPKILLLNLCVLVLIDWLSRREGFDHYLDRWKHRPARWVLYQFLLLMIILFGSFTHTEFIYFQF